MVEGCDHIIVQMHKTFKEYKQPENHMHTHLFSHPVL